MANFRANSLLVIFIATLQVVAAQVQTRDVLETLHAVAVPDSLSAMAMGLAVAHEDDPLRQRFASCFQPHFLEADASLLLLLLPEQAVEDGRLQTHKRLLEATVSMTAARSKPLSHADRRALGRVAASLPFVPAELVPPLLDVAEDKSVWYNVFGVMRQCVVADYVKQLDTVYERKA